MLSTRYLPDPHFYFRFAISRSVLQIARFAFRPCFGRVVIGCSGNEACAGFSTRLADFIPTQARHPRTSCIWILIPCNRQLAARCVSLQRETEKNVVSFFGVSNGRSRDRRRMNYNWGYSYRLVSDWSVLNDRESPRVSNFRTRAMKCNWF